MLHVLMRHVLHCVQAALAEPAVGVAVWVRVLLPQLLGVLLPQLLGISNLPSAAAATAGNQKHSSGSSNSSNSSGAAAEQVKPLEASLQGPAVDFVTGLLEELDVPVGDAAGSSAGGVKSIVAAEEGADVACEDAGAVPTVPGAAVEALSRSMAGKLAAATASSAETKKNAAARAGGGSAAAAAAALAPLLPSLAALAAGSSCPAQYGDWLLLALESAALSDGEHCHRDWLSAAVTLLSVSLNASHSGEQCGAAQLLVYRCKGQRQTHDICFVLHWQLTDVPSAVVAAAAATSCSWRS